MENLLDREMANVVKVGMAKLAVAHSLLWMDKGGFVWKQDHYRSFQLNFSLSVKEDCYV